MIRRPLSGGAIINEYEQFLYQTGMPKLMAIRNQPSETIYRATHEKFRSAFRRPSVVAASLYDIHN